MVPAGGVFYRKSFTGNEAMTKMIGVSVGRTSRNSRAHNTSIALLEQSGEEEEGDDSQALNVVGWRDSLLRKDYSPFETGIHDALSTVKGDHVPIIVDITGVGLSFMSYINRFTHQRNDINAGRLTLFPLQVTAGSSQIHRNKNGTVQVPLPDIESILHLYDAKSLINKSYRDQFSERYEAYSIELNTNISGSGSLGVYNMLRNVTGTEGKDDVDVSPILATAVCLIYRENKPVFTTSD